MNTRHNDQAHDTCPTMTTNDTTRIGTATPPRHGESGQAFSAVPCSAIYPDNWKDIAKRIKDAAGWQCERCKEPHRVEGAFVLTVHHLDGNKANCADWNLAALCQRCHLKIQGRVKMDQMFFAEILDVSEWFKPHLEGFLRAKSPNTELSDGAGENR